MDKVSDYIKEIVFGGTDGIITTFAVVAGFNGALVDGSDMLGLSFTTVLLFGLANLFADALSMGLGNFLSVRSELDVFRSRKNVLKESMNTDSKLFLNESNKSIMKLGMNSDQAAELSVALSKTPEYWLEFLVGIEGVSNPKQARPALTGIVIFLAFIVFGAIPLLPYLLGLESSVAFGATVISTAIALLVLGLIRANVSKASNKPLVVLESLLVGGLAAIVAFGVGTLFA